MSEQDVARLQEQIKTLFSEVIDLATFLEAKCGECWKTEICEIVG